VNTQKSSRCRCLCCGYRTLDAPGALSLCPVCWWQDDGQGDEDANVVRGAANGALSLTQARENYRVCGAADPEFLPHVRAPLPFEAV
jgi:Cysteine-rich CPCC